MKIDALDRIHFNPEIKSVEHPKPELSFMNWLMEKLEATNEHLNTADQALQQLAWGQVSSLHQTMLTLEQAKLSFQFLEQVRNRLMSAYQEIMREQI